MWCDRCGFPALDIPVIGDDVSFYNRSMREVLGLPANRTGVSDLGSEFVNVQGLFTVWVAELRSFSEGVLTRLLG